MPVAQEKSNKELQLEKIESEIAAVERKKLITIVTPGGSDKVIYVTPFDLRGKDPEEIVEEEEKYVIETKFDQGFAQHQTGTRKTGKKLPRWKVAQPGKMTGPFGPTYKIDVTRQEGELEFNNFKRILDNHVSRLSKVPDPVSYHSDVDERGMLDLRNISITKDDVPVALLEGYEPLTTLQAKRKELLAELGRDEQPELLDEPLTDAEKFEARATQEAQKNIHQCKEPGCDFVTRSVEGLAKHQKKQHP